MKEFNATNTGNRVVINCASTRDVLRLKQVISKELIKHPIGLKVQEGGGKDLLDKDIDLSGIIEFIKNTLLALDGSEEFNEVVFECLKYCTYKSTYKIDLELFDNKAIPEAREDYYEIILACVEENLRPFLKSLVSTWKTHIQTGKIAQLLNLQ